LRLAGITDCPPRRVDPRSQRRSRDDPAAPHRLQQVVFGNNSITVLYEVSEKIKDLRLNSDRFGAAPQLAAISVERIPAERELHRL